MPERQIALDLICVPPADAGTKESPGVAQGGHQHPSIVGGDFNADEHARVVGQEGPAFVNHRSPRFSLKYTELCENRITPRDCRTWETAHFPFL